jgi:hypothetical protein
MYKLFSNCKKDDVMERLGRRKEVCENDEGILRPQDKSIFLYQ